MLLDDLWCNSYLKEEELTELTPTLIFVTLAESAQFETCVYVEKIVNLIIDKTFLSNYLLF